MRKLLFIAIVAIFAGTFQSCKDDGDDDTTTTVKDGITLTSAGSLKLSINHVYGNSQLAMSPAVYITDAQDTIKVTQLTYYISNVTLKTAEGTTKNLANYNLIEFTPGQNSEITLTNVPAGTYTSISYMVGVDNTANSTGSHTGDLDPSLGMYWTWNTGYVFIRLKGRYTAQNNAYSFDIGGDNNQMAVSHSLLAHKISGTSATATIAFDLDKVFSGTNTYDLKTDATDIHSTTATEAINKLKPNIAGAFALTAVQ
jgi:hypothetical protein